MFEFITIDFWGTIAVSLMALFYMLERRHKVYVLLFALACLASSAYAVAIQSWPFAVIEFLWAGIAFWRWYQSSKETS